MSAFREVRYGLLFFAWSMFGLIVGGCTGAGIAGHGTNQWDEMADLTAAGAVCGAIFGAFGWLAFKYAMPKNPQI
jgi:hypothetical protein